MGGMLLASAIVTLTYMASSSCEKVEEPDDAGHAQ